MTTQLSKALDPSANVYLGVGLLPRPLGPNIWTGFPILLLTQELVKELERGQFLSSSRGQATCKHKVSHTEWDSSTKPKSSPRPKLLLGHK